MTYLDKNGLQAVTNKLVQGEAIKVVSSKGHNVKDVINNIKDDCNDIKNPFLYKIENKVSNFRVGKGKDINITREIKEYNTELEFKGKTYQNLTSRGMSFKVQNFEGIFVQEDGPDSLLVTRISDDYQGWLYACNMKLKRALIKPNTKYTLIFKLDANKEITMPVSLRDGNALNPITNQVNAVNVCSNIYVATLTTVSDFAGLGPHQVIYFHGYYPKATGDWCRYYHDIILLEGDYSNTPVEEFPKYFEEIKSSFEEGIVDVKVKGKNLFDTTKLIASSGSDNPDVSIVALKDKFLLHGVINNSWTSFATSNSLPPGTYSLQVYNKRIPWGGKGKIWGYNSEGELILNVGGGTTFTLEEEAKNIRFIIQYFNAGDLVDCEITIQIEEGTKITPYEPYYENHISFNIGAPLMSLPNGVCDEIRNNNGQWELVRRVDKIVCNGSEQWQSAQAYTGFSRFLLKLNDYPWSNSTSWGLSSINDRVMSRISQDHGGYEYVYIQAAAATNCYYQLSTNKVTSLEAFKQWLAKNPTTIYYEKGAPEIIPIEPVKAYIKTGATIAINSEIVPTSYHKVTLDRGEQIEQAIVEISALKAKIDTLETAYDSYLLETQHKLSLLGFEYQLESEEI